MKTTLTYPSNTVAPSIYTDFVNGVKFDVCEVIKEAHDMLSSSKARFFLCVEDEICGFKSAENYFQKTGEERWDFFCKTKQECIDMIKSFSDDYDKIERLQEKYNNKPVFKHSCLEQINLIRQKCLNIYGVKPL